MRMLVRAAFALAVLSSPGYAQQKPEVHVLPVQGNVYMLVTPDGNMAAQIGSDGVLMVDTGSARMTDQTLAAVKQLAKPITNEAAPVHRQHRFPSGPHRRQ